MSCKQLGHCWHAEAMSNIERNVVRYTKKCCECGWVEIVTTKLTPADEAYKHGPYLPKRIEVA
jgi:hypothetical protein